MLRMDGTPMSPQQTPWISRTNKRTGPGAQRGHSNDQSGESDDDDDDQRSETSDSCKDTDAFIRQIAQQTLDISTEHFEPAIQAGTIPSEWGPACAKALYMSINRACRLQFFTSFSLDAPTRTTIIQRWIGPRPHQDISKAAAYDTILELIKSRANHWPRNWQARALDCFEMHFYRLNRHVRENSHNKSDLLRMPGTVADYVSNHFFAEAPLAELFPFVKKVIDLDMVREWAHPDSRGLQPRQVVMGQWLNTFYAWALSYMAQFYGSQLVANGYVAQNTKDIEFKMSPAQAGVRQEGRTKLIERLRAMGCGRSFTILDAQAWPELRERQEAQRKKRIKLGRTPIDDIDPSFRVLGGGSTDRIPTAEQDTE